MKHESRMARFDETDLYVVITESFCEGRSPIEVLEAVLEAGVKLVQFREKGHEDGELYERAMAFRKRCADAGALLIVDDRIDIALAVGADGVHLGRSDMPIDVGRAIAPDLIIGASTHTLDQARTAQTTGASYVNIGPIFATQTKTGTAEPLGPDMIGLIGPHLEVPFTCMGGIKPHNIEEVLAQGARHIALVTAVTAQPDVYEAAKALRALIHRHKIPV